MNDYYYHTNSGLHIYAVGDDEGDDNEDEDDDEDEDEDERYKFYEFL